MKGKMSTQTIVYGGLAVVLFVLLFALTFQGWTGEKSVKQPKVVAFGDSVLGLVRDETSVTSLLQDRLGVEVFNAGFGGTCIAKNADNLQLSYPKNCLTMVGLTEAVLAEDFGIQQSLQWRESNMQYFPEVVDALEEVDFMQVEVVLIQQGINDYHAGTPLENPENLMDEYTVAGALRSSVETLRRVNPRLRIVLITPTYGWYAETGQTCEEADFGGGVLEDYVNVQLRVSEELGVEVIDVYHDFYPHEKWEDKDLYTWDGVHPNEMGREKLAARIAEVLVQERTE